MTIVDKYYFLNNQSAKNTVPYVTKNARWRSQNKWGKGIFWNKSLNFGNVRVKNTITYLTIQEKYQLKILSSFYRGLNTKTTMSYFTGKHRFRSQNKWGMGIL